MIKKTHIQPCVSQVEADWLESEEDGSDYSGDEQLQTDNAVDLPQKSYTTNRHCSTNVLLTQLQTKNRKTTHHH